MTIETLFYIMLFAGLGVELFFYFHERNYEKKVLVEVIPEIKEFAPQDYDWQRELSYGRVRGNFSLFSSLTGFAATLLFFLSGIFSYFMTWIGTTWASPFWQGFWFAFITAVVYSIWRIPFSWYRSFVIEERFGFNRKTPLIFWKDQGISFLLSLAIAPLLLGFINLLAEKSFGIPMIFVTVITFSLVMSFIFPLFIMPLFYSITTLEEGELRKGIDRIISEEVLPVKGVFKADQSRRSSHGNAMVAGLGKSKKVILFDTLINSMDNCQVLAVVAHELGHWSKRHIPKMLAAGIIQEGILFLIVWLIWTSPFSASVFNVEGMTLARLLVVLFIVSSLMELVLSPLNSRISRKYEFQADNYAAKLTGAKQMQGALSSLATNDLAWIPPSPLSSAWFSSHPSIPERIMGLSETSSKARSRAFTAEDAEGNQNTAE